MKRRHTKRKIVFRVSIIISIIIVVFQPACRLFNMDSPTVVAWSPEKDFITVPKNTDVSLTFSTVMDRTSTEESFTLTADGEPVNGRFLWDGGEYREEGGEEGEKTEKTLRFEPYTRLQENKVYEISLDTAAEDTYGNNLYKRFVHRFNTGEDETRPSVVAVTPSDGSITDDPHQHIIIEFSEPVDKADFYAGCSITPSIEGYFTWNEDHSTVHFVPNNKLGMQRRYTVTLEDTVRDTAGNFLGDSYSFSFRTGSDTEGPSVVAVTGENGSPVLIADDPDDGSVFINGGWETGDNLRIVFSEPVLIAAPENALIIEPAVDFEPTQTTDSAVTETVLSVSDRFTYDTLFSLTVTDAVCDASENPLEEEMIYRFRTNGAGSLPPRVTGVTFLRDPPTVPPDGTVIVPCSAFEEIDLTAYKTIDGEEGFFDLYFTVADGAEIDPLSFMENISVSTTNSCADITIIAVEPDPSTSGGTYPSPEPAPGPGEQVVRLYVSIREQPENGVVRLLLSDGMTDTLGNHLRSDWIFPLNDTTP